MSTSATLLVLPCLLNLVCYANAYFCSRFFADIQDRTPYVFHVNDSSPVGYIVNQFERPDGHNRKALTFTSGDLSYIHYDVDDYSLKVAAPLYGKIGETLEIYGTCVDFINLISYEINIAVKMSVVVMDSNDAPVFSNIPTTLSIKEGSTLDVLNFPIVLDNSLDRHEDFIKTTLWISEVSSDSGIVEDSPFSLSDDGTLQLSRPLDYETDPHQYDVTITAEDCGSPPESNWSVVTVDVVDVDDMPPVFAHNETFKARVRGDKPIQHKSCFHTNPPILATDMDEGLKTDVRYQIIEGIPVHWKAYFGLDDESGELCQLESIPRLALDEDTGKPIFNNFTFTIHAYQIDDKNKFAIGSVQVEVRDWNEHAPEFQQSEYSTAIAEYPTTRTGHKVIQVTALDHDHGANGKLEYIIDGNTSQAFRVDKKTGWIIVANQTALDREQKEVWKFKVIALETESADGWQDETDVTITLDDVNDNRPWFDQRQYMYTIKDTLQPGLPVHENDSALMASDADLGDNGRLQYSVISVWRKWGGTSLTDLGRFTIDPDHGSLQLAGTLSDLRRQRQRATYKLKITATDMAKNEKDRKSAHAFVIINVEEANDFPPFFVNEQTEIQINESLPILSTITTLEVHDKDGDEDVFLMYDIISGNEEGFFHMETGGRFILNKPLDREKQEQYVLEIQVYDGLHAAHTKLIIKVEDVNDNPPRFTYIQYIFRIEEEPDVGSVIGQIWATDEDLSRGGDVNYEIRGELANTLLKITKNGSIIVRTKHSSFDREQNSDFHFTVAAYDNGDPILTNTVEVTVLLEDINDNPPTFPFPVYYGWVLEDDMNPMPQTVTLDIHLNATDLDVTFRNRDIRYYLSGTGNDVFEMDPYRADMVVRNPGSIDCESTPQYTLLVSAVDAGGSGQTAETRLVITVRDENDNAPEFDGPLEFQAHHDIQKDTILGRVHAQDRDVSTANNDVIYLLKKGGYGKFGIDYVSGDIFLADSIEREPHLDHYELDIEALDGGKPRKARNAKVNIHIPYNHPPQILKNSTRFRVRENAQPRTSVGHLKAKDEKGHGHRTLKFFIKDQRVPFTVSPSGHIHTTRTLDREHLPVYDFDVYVTDQGSPPRTSSALVTVSVDDMNDSPPRFTLRQYKGYITEDNRRPKPGQSVRMTADIVVIDGDTDSSNLGMQFTLSGPDKVLFVIDTHTAAIRVSERAAGQIDREKREFFKLKLVATDESGYGFHAEAALTIYIDDVNDEVPRFYTRRKHFVVGEDWEAGRPIGRIHAKDPDATSPNNKVIYLLENDSLGKFSIETYTGNIIPLKGLLYQPRHEIYTLRVAALDLGFPNQKTTDTIHIRVDNTPDNDHAPLFEGRRVFIVQEEVPIGSLVGTLKARDPDELGPDDGITYQIKAESPVPFSISADDGSVRTSDRVDADTGTSVFLFTVTATDAGSPPRESSTDVAVVVQDINDNPPVFTQELYHVYAADYFPTGTVVATPFAHDSLDGHSEEVRSACSYSMEGPGAGVYLTMNSVNGQIQTTERFAEINATQVRYELTARDSYNFRLTARSQLIVDILKAGAEHCCCQPPCPGWETPQPLG